MGTAICSLQLGGENGEFLAVLTADGTCRVFRDLVDSYTENDILQDNPPEDLGTENYEIVGKGTVLRLHVTLGINIKLSYKAVTRRLVPLYKLTKSTHNKISSNNSKQEIQT